MQTSSGRGNRILLFRTAAAAASLLLALLAAEIGVRIFAPYESPLASPPAGRINPYGENSWLAKAAPWGHFHKPYALYHPATEEYETTYRIGSRSFRIPE